MNANQNTALQSEAPPFANPEIERAILGAVLLDSELLEETRTLLTYDDFAIESHRHILHAMNRMQERREYFSPLLLKAELGRMRHDDAVPIVTTITDAAAPLDDLAAYARLLKRLTRERRLFQWLDDSRTRLTNGETCDTLLTEAADFFFAFPTEEPASCSGFYASLAEFCAADLAEPEVILTGLHRGEVGELAAAYGIGKTTLLMNVGLKLAAGEAFPPLIPETSVPRRVVYVNGDISGWHWRQQLVMMLQSLEQAETAWANFTPLVDAKVDGEALNLSLEHHWQQFTRWLKQQPVDLVIVDSLASLFPALQESDSRHLASQVMRRLQQLARQVNCAVLFAHQPHTGNHSGRQQAMMAAMAATVYRLERCGGAAERQRLLSCEKSRGAKLAATVLQLADQQQWFAICEAQAATTAQSGLPTLAEIVDFVKGKQGARTAEILRYFIERASPRKMAYLLKDAELLGLLEKAGHKAAWQVCRNDGAEKPKQRVQSIFLEDGPIPENLDPEVKYYVFEKRKPSPCYRCGAPGYLFVNCEQCGAPR